jgi:hypothetical protein
MSELSATADQESSPVLFRHFVPADLENAVRNELPALEASARAYERAKLVSQALLDQQVCVWHAVVSSVQLGRIRPARMR